MCCAVAGALTAGGSDDCLCFSILLLHFLLLVLLLVVLRGNYEACGRGVELEEVGLCMRCELLAYGVVSC